MQSCSNTTHTQHLSFPPNIIPQLQSSQAIKQSTQQDKSTIMKANTVITVFVTTLSFAVTGLCVHNQATHNLRPRTLDAHASSNVSATQNVSLPQGNVNEKDFTFDELFTLQKRFLDNFISPQNDIQVRLYLSDLHPTCANSYSRRSRSIRHSLRRMSKDALTLPALLMAAS